LGVAADLHVAQARIVEIGAAGDAPHFVLELSDEAGNVGVAALPASSGIRAALSAALASGDAVPPETAGAIENALFDLRCRKLGVPQHTLLGGAIRGAVPLVAAVDIAGAGSPEALERAARLLDDLHARVLSLHVPIDNADNVAAAVELFSRRYGSDVTLRLVLHGSLPDDSRLRHLERALRGVTLECCYAEAGTRPLDLGVTPVGLLARGARLDGLRDLSPHAELNAVLTDARTLGGLAALERVAAVGQVFQLEVGTIAPTGSPLDLLANAHSVASGFALHGGVEISRVPDFALFGASAADFLRGGAIVLSDTPGLGLALDTAALRERGLAIESIGLPTAPSASGSA